MSDELNDGQDILTPDEDTTSEDEESSNESADVKQQDGSDDKLTEALAQKKHWRDKAVDTKTGKTYKTLYEEHLKSVKKGKEVQPTQSYITKDEYEEGILRTSKGYDDDDVKLLNVLAKGNGFSLFQAEQDEVFKTHLAKKAEAEKVSKAQLGASKGSSESGSGKTPTTRDEHKEIWKEKLGR